MNNGKLPSKVFESPDTAGSSKGRDSAEVDGPALLVPADREVEELEERWLGKLPGHLRVEREIRMEGYGLYSLRTW